MQKLSIVLLMLLNSIVFGQQTANEVILKVVVNKDKNAIKEALKSYQYNSYSKLLFTIDKSLIEGKIDSIFETKKNKTTIKVDSTNYFYKQESNKQHFYISEKISEDQFVNGKSKENILAIKMAGFKEPIYELIALGIANISFYDDKVNVFGTDYVSPLAKKSFKDYHFSFDEFNNDSTKYIVKYKSINRKKSIGLQGEFHIDKTSFAITKSITTIKGQVSVFVEQNYIFLPKHNIWFPKKTTFLLRKGASKSSIKAFRKLIGYRSNYISERNINPEDVSYILINSNNFKIAINKPITIAKSDCDAIIGKKAIDRNSDVWNTYKLASTNKKDINTYTFLDSLAKSKNATRKLNVLRKLLEGKYATKLLDIDLSNVINFNNHEGFRLGFGGTTNSNLSSKFRLNGYLANGNKDKQLKYSYGAEISLNKKTDTWFGGSFTNDIFEAAKSKLLFKEPNFALINPRNTNISQFYTYKITEAHINHEISPRLISKLQFDAGLYKNEFDYTYISNTKLLNNYHLSNLTLAMQWSPFSKYLQSPRGKFLIKKGYPKINIELTKSFDNVFKGDFNFKKANLTLEHQIKTIKSGSTTFLLKAGLVLGEAPLSHLYNVTPNHSLITPWRARINLSGTNAFETMLFNEFISDKYVSLQARQNLEKFRIGKNFKPKLSFITRFAIGDIANASNHRQVTFNSLKKGYFESGFVLNQLFYGLGVSGFYRYGAYQLPKFEDNVSLKITYVIGLF